MKIPRYDKVSEQEFSGRKVFHRQGGGRVGKHTSYSKYQYVPRYVQNILYAGDSGVFKGSNTVGKNPYTKCIGPPYTLPFAIWNVFIFSDKNWEKSTI